MERQNNYISISEFAKLKNVSVSAVYKRLDRSLKPFVKIIDGKRYLSADALDFDGIQPVEEGLKNAQANQESPGQAETDARSQSQDKENAVVLVALEALQAELREKNKQIALLQEETKELRAANAEKDKFILEQANRLSILLEQSQELQRNNQILLGAAQKAQDATTPAEAVPEQLETIPAEEPAEPPRPVSFWDRVKEFFR